MAGPNNQLRIYEVRTYLKNNNITGIDQVPFYVVSGSRMLVTLAVISADLGTTVSLEVQNTFDVDLGYTTLDAIELNAAGQAKKIFSDFNNLFNLKVTVSGGNASYRVAVALFDNAITTTIQNAQVDVDLNHTVDSEGHFDSLRIGDGTEILSINPDGSINSTVSATNLDIRDLTFASDKVDVTGSEVSLDPATIAALNDVTVSATDLDIRNLDASQDNVAISDGTDTLAINVDGSINSVVTAVDLDIRNLDADQDSVSAHLLDNNGDPFSTVNPLPTTIVENESLNKISGTIDGLKSGTEYGFVNNLRLQILASHDRIETYTYFDFGTKNQRVSKVEYTSVTFSGFTVERVFNYVLDSGRYRRTTVNWNII